MSYTVHKAYAQQFARRRKSLIRRTNQLAQLCQADIALTIRKNNRYYTYRSLIDQSWPPTRAEIVGRWVWANDIITKAIQEKTYPLPIEMSPKDFESNSPTVQASSLNIADSHLVTAHANSDKVDKRSQSHFFDTILHSAAIPEDVRNATDQSATTQVDRRLSTTTQSDCKTYQTG